MKECDMQFLHWNDYVGPTQVIQVTLDSQANVLLLDDLNFSAYQRGSSFDYRGGLAKRSPINLIPPHRARWHVVVDLGGYGRSVRAGVRVLGCG
jgi:hypothetical protein